MRSNSLEVSPPSFFRLGVILLVFPFVFVYALPQTSLVSGERPMHSSC